MHSQQQWAVSILTYNSRAVLPACLDSLQESAGAHNWHILVVDNASSDGVGKLVASKYPKVEFLQVGNNKGYTGGHNTALRELAKRGFKQVLLLNPDVRVSNTCLSHMAEALNGDANVMVVAPKIYMPDGKTIESAGGMVNWQTGLPKYRGRSEPDNLKYNQRQKVGLASGACLLLRLSCIEEIGLFDERYFLYWDDADLSTRVVRSGRDILYVPEAMAIHDRGTSSAGNTKVDTTYYYVRGALLFYEKFTYPEDVKRLQERFISTQQSWHSKQAAPDAAERIQAAKRGIEDYYARRFGKQTSQPLNIPAP